MDCAKSKVVIKMNMNTCRICLGTKKPLCGLFNYQHSGNYAEMLTAVADVKVAANDGLPDKICSKCCSSLEKAYVVKTMAERSDKRLRKQLDIIEKSTPKKKIAFDSITDIKSEISQLNVKAEPKWEMEIEVLKDGAIANTTPLDDIVIANTVIRKVDGTADDTKLDFFKNESADVTWGKLSNDYGQADYLDDDFFQDDDHDDDYVPEVEDKKKIKVKKPKVIKLLKNKKDNQMTVIKKVKVIRKVDGNDKSSGNLITCYPVSKNGSKGAPILLKRPKDSTILKVSPAFKSMKAVVLEKSQVSIRENKPIKVIRGTRTTTVIKQKEKLVCPVCGILTNTLGNHMATHQDKKKYTCSHCPKTFAQKGNLHTHMKYHTGIKDHICEICGAGFYNQKGLIRHNLIHKGERPYGCTLCPKRFIARCDLNRHLRIHSGYKPYKCPTCTMSFNAKHQLQNHERMHTGERPYSCQVCNVAFSYKVNLNNHVLKSHGINLKFKSIHTVTEDVLRREMQLPHLDMPEQTVALTEDMYRT